MKIFVSIASLIILALMGWLGFALHDSKPGEVAGALSGILGGLIGAGGAAIAVYLTLTMQRQEDKERVRSALVREVMEFSRFINGHLDTCKDIHAGTISSPMNKFAESMSMPAPIIYPAVADKIGLLPSPQGVVVFYSTIAEAGIKAQSISNGPIGNTILNGNIIWPVVKIWYEALQLAQGIIEKSRHDETSEIDVLENVLKVISAQIADTRQKFNITN